MNVNEAQKIWKEVSTTINAIHKLYIQISDELDNKKAKRMADLEMNFQRGIFEAAFEKNNLDKKYYPSALVYCWKQHIISCNLPLSAEKIDQFANDFYISTEDGLKYEDSLKKMLVKLMSSAKKSYKEGGNKLSVDAMLKIWQDESMQIEAPIKKDAKNFLGKLFD